MNEEEWIVDGFLFASQKEAEAAEADVRKITQLEKKLNYGRMDAVAMVYVKSIQNGLFHTVVGQAYLKSLQQRLEHEEYDKIDFRKIPIPTGESRTEEEDAEQGTRRQSGVRIRTHYHQELKKKLRTARWMNVILVIVVIALFVIAMTGENANILNYRYNIQNEYSEWQKQLQEREAAVLEREKALEQTP